ncbi:Helix-turn-helix transcriptional regulator [Rhodovastum atsumiense]|uniref:Helix-turn-helix transcriptional regulator n=1 Tax=Rhodovastum atsumiense TaxID=504468 RepID=A0A5M6IQJ8_9PROT|nr:helix-turn-helix transcriptional regulator [Rhodovastum atsumiense]KAA5610550.1 helix-turn-helix transcriptional regulator [Rhodovastum atsumiense]CAH2604996.1 Helix-turn-helix transcriptional regulator [Rhodovastum atsumiense]
MRFTEIGQQLRAYRLESGLRAEEIAARLGVSRAALYRYEKGEVIKLDTIKRLAELLKISPLSLLGIGVEYYHRPIGYFERIRQIEETTDQILQVDGMPAYLVTSDSYDTALAAAFEETGEQTRVERGQWRATAEQVLGILAARKRLYAVRKPGIICILSLARLTRFLETGIAGTVPLSERTRRLCRQVAAAEVQNIAALMEAEPMGLQFGLLTGTEPTGSFKILRARDRAMLAVNPFRPDSPPGAATGVAMITGADEAIAAHQRVAEALWKEAVKGTNAAARVRDLLATQMVA